MLEENTAIDLVGRLRSGYRLSEAEATAWNVAQTVHSLRQQITDSDLTWIMPAITEDEGPVAGFYVALLQPFGSKAQVRDFLVRRFEAAGPYLKTQLLWRLLDDPALPAASHDMLFNFILSDWGFFQNACVAYLGRPSQILAAALGRIAECPATKRWVYLCCLPQYADDQTPVKGVLTIAAASTEAFTARVARTLMERFFPATR